MAKILPSVTIIFTILCLACALNVPEGNRESKSDVSPKDSPEVAAAASSKNHSSGRIIRPSAWSKEEERELKQTDGRNSGNEDQDLLYDEQFSLLNIKKFFRYFTSLLYAVDENNDESWKKATNNMVLKMQDLTSTVPLKKSEDNVNNEMRNFQKNDAPDKLSDNGQFQNSSTSDSPNNISDGGKMQNFLNNGSLDSKQSANTPKSETQNPADSQDNGGMQNSPSNNLTSKPSNDGNDQKPSNNKQPTGKPRLETQNSNNKNPTEKSENNMKTQTQSQISTLKLNLSFASIDTQDDEGMKNTGSNKPLNDENAQKTSHKNSFNNNQPTENSKLSTQKSNDKDSVGKSENDMETQTQNPVNTNTQDNRKMQNSPSDNSSNNPPSDGNTQNFSDNDSSNNKQPTGNLELETQNSTDKDSNNNSKNNMKTETKNPNESNILKKFETGGEIQNFSLNDNLNKPPGTEKMQTSSNNNSTNSLQPTKNLEDSQLNSMNKDNLNEGEQDTTKRNSSNNNNQQRSIPALKTDKHKEDLTETVFNDYYEYKTAEVALDDNTTKYIPEEKVDNYDDIDKEQENDDDEDDTNENDMNANETENDTQENDVEDGTEKEINENDVVDDNVNESNYDGNENKPDFGKQNFQPEITVQEKTDDRSIILPKFIIQAIRDQQSYSETLPLKHHIDNNANVTPESVKSENKTNERSPSPEFQLSSNEFVDDYINNRQEQNPQKENEKASNVAAFNPNVNNGMNEKNILPIPIFLSKFKKDNMPLNAAPPIKESMKHQKMPFHQSQNTEDSFWPETNALPYQTFNKDKKGPNRNQDLLTETFTPNVPYTFTSVDEPVFATQENIQNEEVTPQKFIPFQQGPYFPDLQGTFTAPQKDYNTFTQPAILGFQDTIPSVKTFHSDVPATDEYKPAITSPFQLPNIPFPLQNEGYLNDQHGSYNFQDEKTPTLNNKNNQQPEQNQPIAFQPDMFSNTQHISNKNTPNEPGKKTYFTNYKTEMPVNVEKLEPNTEMPSNQVISDSLQLSPSFNQIYNQDSSPTGTENNTDKLVSQEGLDTTKPQNQVNNVQTINQPLENNFPREQMLFPQSDKLSQQNEMKNRILPDKSKMSSDMFPAQDETDNAEFPLRQKNTKNSKEVPRDTFNITEDNLQIKPENEDSPSVSPENVPPKSQSPQAVSSKPLIDESQKSPTFGQTADQEENISSSDSDFRKNEIENDNLSENNYESEDETNEDEDQDEEEEEDEYDEYEDDDYVIEDDYISEDNYYSDSNEDENEGEDENEKEDGDKDDYENENKYDHDETEISRNSQNPQTTVVINEETSGSTTRSPNFENQVKSDQQNNSMTQSPTSYDNTISEAPKSQSMTNKENPSSNFELSSDGFRDDYINNRLGESLPNGNEVENLSDGTVNDATIQNTQKPEYGDTKDAIQSSGISKSESASEQGGNFDTILEYIYKNSNSSLFKNIKEGRN